MRLWQSSWGKDLGLDHVVRPAPARRAPQPSRFAKLALAAAILGGAVGGSSLAIGQGSSDPAVITPAQARCAIWFVGSSSIRRWTTLTGDMKPWFAQNYGVDGITIRELTARFIREPIIPRPQAIVFYGGDNDIAYGKTSAEAIEDLRAFLDARSSRMGAMPVFLLSLKPSPARWGMYSELVAFNQAARSIAEASPTVTFIDIAPRMLAKRRPGPFFVADGIHMNEGGYRIWREAVSRALRKALPKPVARACARTAGG